MKLWNTENTPIISKVFKALSMSLFFVFFLNVSLVNATTLTVDFPSEDATVVGSVGTITPGEFGYFWSMSRGDSISETFAGTGFHAIDQLALDFEVTQNVLNSGASTLWDVFVNNVLVGGWSWLDTDGVGSVNELYSFAPIIGAGTYDIRMEVTNEVGAGFGSIAIGYPGSATLTSVPEPASISMILLALAGFGFGFARKNVKPRF